MLAKINATDYNTQWVAQSGGAGVTDGDKGDITVSGSGTSWQINADKITTQELALAAVYGENVVDDEITNTKLANMVQATIKGRAVGVGTGDPTDLTATQATAVLDLFATTATTKGLVPGSNNVGSTYFLNGAGTWAVPAGAGGGTAVATTYAGSTNLVATNVEAALDELDTEKVAKVGDTLTGPLSFTNSTDGTLMKLGWLSAASLYDLSVDGARTFSISHGSDGEFLLTPTLANWWSSKPMVINGYTDVTIVSDDGDVIIDSHLVVNASSAFNGGVSLNTGNLTLFDGDLDILNNGVLTVTGSTHLNGDVYVDPDAHLEVNGTSAFYGQLTVDTIRSTDHMGTQISTSGLYVMGMVTTEGALVVNGAPTELSGPVDITGSVDITGTVNVDGNLTVYEQFSTSGEAIFGGPAYLNADPVEPLEAATKLYVDGRVAKAGDTMTGDLLVPDEAYGVGWNGVTEVPTKNAVYTKIESLPVGITQAAADTRYVNTAGGDAMAGPLQIRGADDSSCAVDLYNAAGSSQLGALRGFTGLVTLNSSGSSSTLRLQVGAADRLTVANTVITAAVPVALPANPASALHAAPKQYVDQAVFGLFNASITTQATFTADSYLIGSSITIPTPATMLRAKTIYKCMFNVVKTAAGGTATPIINVRYGTAGTTSDTSRGTLTWQAQTNVADEGMFEIFCVFRTVGSSTSAVLQSMGRLSHRLSITGLGTGVSEPEIATSAGFDSTVANSIIGLSVNGGSSAGWTVTMVEAELINLAAV